VLAVSFGAGTTVTALDKRVSKMWAYRFMARNTGTPIKQKTEEYKRIQAEDSGLLFSLV
jgi:hypothetical protein